MGVDWRDQPPEVLGKLGRLNWRDQALNGSPVHQASSATCGNPRQVNEEEKRRLERQVSEQVEALKRKQQEYARLKAGWGRGIVASGGGVRSRTRSLRVAAREQ